MLIGCTMNLMPAPPPVPFQLLLARWLRFGFARSSCRAIVEQSIAQDPILGEEDRPWLWSLDRRTIRMDADEMRAAAAVIRAAARAGDRAALALAAADYFEDSDGIESVLSLMTRPAQREGYWPAAEGAGISRREHASLAIRSRTTTILTDPKSLAKDWTTNGGRYPSDERLGGVDGIVITHGHADHWHLPSILRFATDDSVQVIVPRVPRRSLLADEDMLDSVTRAGLSASAPDWHSTVRMGDIDIDVLRVRNASLGFREISPRGATVRFTWNRVHLRERR